MGDGESDPVRICWVPGAHEGDIATALAVGHERLAVVETIPDDVSRLLAGDSIDGIVCGQDLDGVTGTALLAAIRDEFPDLPVILYPHDAGRAVASDAVSLGVTEYLPGGQEGVAPDAVADRIVDAVDDRRRDRTFAAHEKRYQSMLDTVGDVVYTLDRDGKITSANLHTSRAGDVCKLVLVKTVDAMSRHDCVAESGGNLNETRIDCSSRTMKRRPCAE